MSKYENGEISSGDEEELDDEDDLDDEELNDEDEDEDEEDDLEGEVGEEEVDEDDEDVDEDDEEEVDELEEGENDEEEIGEHMDDLEADSQASESDSEQTSKKNVPDNSTKGFSNAMLTILSRPSEGPEAPVLATNMKRAREIEKEQEEYKLRKTVAGTTRTMKTFAHVKPDVEEKLGTKLSGT